MRLNKPALDVVFKKMTEYNKLHSPSNKELKKINFTKSIILEIKDLNILQVRHLKLKI